MKSYICSFNYLKMRFSQRIGKRQVKTVLQVESMDDALKNRLWNTILESFLDKLSDYDDNYGSESTKSSVCKQIWKEFFGFPVDEIPKYSNYNKVYTDGVVQFIRDWFYKTEWYDIYDFVEFLSVNPQFAYECNIALKKGISGYRIVDGKVVQITSEEEVQEIEEALLASDDWKPVNTHLKSALDLLADKKNPDYRNSIKESISAVEAICKKITGNPKATLGPALIELERSHSLDGSLKAAFNALYGYASNEGGIRHAMRDDSIEPTFEDAKFMLVSCSAFINYLKAKMNI